LAINDKIADIHDEVIEMENEKEKENEKSEQSKLPPEAIKLIITKMF